METRRMTPELTEALRMVNVVVLDQINAGRGELSAGNTSLEEAHEAAEQVRRRLVSVDANAPSCCIDGRRCIHTLATNEVDRKTSPRPSVAGGADVTAYAAAEMVGDWFGPEDDRPSIQRFADIDTTLRSQGIFPGTHGDEKAESNGFKDPATGAPKTGCGADDKFTDILKRPYDSNEPITKYTTALLGEDYKADHMNFTSNDKLQERVQDWNPVDALKLVTELSEGKNAEILEGSHAEILVVFNFVENTTVDRDALVAETGKQVFVVDMWYLDKIARAMAAGRPDAVTMYSKIKHAMVAYQIATYLTLCDGTHRPVLLTSEYDTEPVA